MNKEQRKNISRDRVTTLLITEKGYKQTLELNPEDIFIPKEIKGTANNITRIKLDRNNITLLQNSLRTPDWTKPLIIIEKIKGGMQVNGKTYRYKLVAGYHRLTALLLNNEISWLFDVYEFETEEERLDLQLIENDHEPRKAIDATGLCNYLAYKVHQGLIKPNTKEAMEKHLEGKLKNVHHMTKASAVRKAVAKCGSYTDVTIRDFDEIKQLLDNPENYEKGVSTYTHSGIVDTKRDKHGWTVLEGYEDEFVFNAIKSFHLDGKESYFTNHVKEPTEKRTLKDRRTNMISNYVKLETALKSVIEFYNKNKKFPWNYNEAFHPQNNVIGKEENKFLNIQ